MIRKILAWGVHTYTAMGMVCAAGITVAIFYEHYTTAFLLMFIATLIDATDGTMARAVKVKEVVPGFDGRRLDDIIDYQTYTALPIFLLWRANLLGSEWQIWLIAPLLASLYGFCQTNIKTDDGYFLGFPSYWNIVAFYLYLFQASAPVTLGLILFLSVMTFVPTRYLYPTMRGRLNRYTNWLGAVWSALLIWIFVQWYVTHDLNDPTFRILLYVSLFFPAYYMGVSYWISLVYLFQTAPQSVEGQGHTGLAASSDGHSPAAE